MGTTVSSLQILGASLEDVRAVLPRALVGKWSERFVTACPGELFFDQLDRKAGTLSKKLACAVLSVSMFDGDAIRLAVFRCGRRVTSHSADPEADTCKAGDPKRFCAALGLPEGLASKLKRLFTECIMQEEKLEILQALLGAPLFLRWNDGEELLPKEPVRADSGPLENWLKEHPAPPKPPKLKNQCKAELLQEIPGLSYHGHIGSKIYLFRPLYRVGDEDDSETLGEYGYKPGDVLGIGGIGGRLGRLMPDGQLELTPLEDPDIRTEFLEQLCGGREVSCLPFFYAALDGRIVTAMTFFAEDGVQSYSPFQSVIFRDSAGILPCPLPLALGDGPVIADKFWLLPGGGCLVQAEPRLDSGHCREEVRPAMLVRYGPDGTVRYTAEDEAGLQPEDIAGLRAVRETDWQVSCSCPVTDSQGRQWRCGKQCVECYSLEGEVLSRHRLPGDIVALYCSDGGQVCAMTNQWKKYTTRVYRFV